MALYPNHLSVGLQWPKGNEHLGYGSFGLALSKGMRSVGIHTLEPLDMNEYLHPKQDIGAVVWAAQPAHAQGRWKNQYTVVYTMWESTQLPDSFSYNLHNFDLVIVPNEFNVEQFSEFNDNVVKVPLGLESASWSYSPRPAPDQTFEFLHCAAGATEKARKGTDLVLNGFEKAFPHWEKMTPSPRLSVKCLKLPPPEKPYLTIHQGKWAQYQLRMLYNDSHCMVLPSRGEGWGYHPVQAVATGMPAIVSDIPGHAEYHWIPGFLVAPTGLSKAPEFLQGDGGQWWEPDQDSIVDLMREVYENYERYSEEAKVGSYQVHGTLTDTIMAQKVAEAVGVEHMLIKRTGAWEKFTERQYATRVTKYLGPDSCDINGERYEFIPGEEYWVPANVRQVLNSAGYLANPDEHRSKVEW